MPHEHLGLQNLHRLQSHADHDDDGSTADSQRGVIDFANDIFEKIMRADLGNVEYDDAAALRCGAQYSPNEGMEPEILLITLQMIILLKVTKP